MQGVAEQGWIGAWIRSFPSCLWTRATSTRHVQYRGQHMDRCLVVSWGRMHAIISDNGRTRR